MASSTVTRQDLRKNEKTAIADDFLTTPCIRCGDQRHACLDCPNTLSDHKQGPYGSLPKGKKMGADIWIDELKKEYLKDKNDSLFDRAFAKKERENPQQSSKENGQKGETSKKSETGAANSTTLEPVHRATDGMQGQDGHSTKLASVPEGSGSQDADTPPVEFNYHYDRKQLPPTKAPDRNSPQRNPISPDRKQSDLNLGKLKDQELDYPARTELAQYKTKESVLTNHFQLTRNTSKKLTLYEFKIPELENKGKRKARAIMESILSNCQVLKSHKVEFATDYFKTIVAWTDLRTHLATAGHVLISPANGPEQYHLLESTEGPMSMSYVRQVDMNDLFEYSNLNPGLAATLNVQQLVDLFNIVISKCVENSGVPTVPGGANKFYRKDGHIALGQGGSLCTLRGYSYTVKAGSGAVLLNVNSLTSAFWLPVMLHHVMLNDPVFGRIDWDVFERAILGLHVRIEYERGDKKNDPKAYARLNREENRIKPIIGLGRAAQDETFVDLNGREITVANHFNATYGQLNRPDLPLVNLGKRDSPRWYPAEKLRIVPYQKFKGLVPSSLTENMLRTACQKPPEAKALVTVEGLETLGVSRNHNKNTPIVLPSCPLFSIRPALLQVDAGRLPFPSIQYGNDSGNQNKIATPEAGRWKFIARHFHRHNASVIFNTLVLHYNVQNAHNNPVNDVVTGFRRWAGATYRTADVRYAADQRLDRLDHATLDQNIRSVMDKGKPVNMAVLVLRSKDIPGYSAFKDLCDRKYGLHALCLTNNRLNGDKWGNITLKINLKAAGSNHTIAGGLIGGGFMKDTLVMGADVTHPGPGSIPGCPSIAAIVGSVDDHAGRFLGSMRLQRESRTEIIDDVEIMVQERIKDWVLEMSASTHSMKFPKRIIYYRDGVSEPQYEDVKNSEVSTFKAAFIGAVNELKKAGKVKADINPDPPSIIAIVCGKRHHVRFYPKDNRSADRKENCHPGTTVDDVVTSPYYQDFYLQSHAAIQGTARPAHYFVITNAPNETVDKLRNFTHELCYTYVRAPVGVSYASPAYYADRLCERGRCYLRHFFVAPGDTPLRNEFERYRRGIEQDVRKNREAAFPKKPKPEKSKSGTRQPKDPKLEKRREEDKNNVDKTCEAWVLQKARAEFERYRQGGNPWHANISKTMFWM